MYISSKLHTKSLNAESRLSEVVGNGVSRVILEGRRENSVFNCKYFHCFMYYKI